MQHHDHANHMAHGTALLDLLPENEATHVAVNNGYWFNPKTWADGRIPDEGAKVFIPEGREVLYAGRSEVALDVVRVDGTLNFSTAHSAKMVVDTMITGFNSKLSIGSESDPIADGKTVEIIIADNGAIDRSWDPDQISRGIVALGEVEMHGAAKTVHTKVADAPMTGDKVITLSETPQNWKVGDKIVIAGTNHVDFQADGSRPSEDEVRIITAINGKDITLDQALAFDHDAPDSALATSVANYSRNIVISSENGDTLAANERGHTMFMHNTDVDVRYVEFDELGRTDKSERLDDFALKEVHRSGPSETIDFGRVDLNNDGVDDAGAMNNIRGRYAVHFHEAGDAGTGDGGYMEGNAVWGSPGWGYVNHSSHADFINNAAFDVFGAAFVGETGDETGLMKGNISIYNEGTSDQFAAQTTSRAAFHGTLNQDMGYAGFGFWFNGRQIELEDNVATGAGEAGYGWTPRGVDQIDTKASALPNELMARGHSTINHPDDGVITVFDNNEAIASWKGVLIDGLGATKNHNGFNMLTDFTGWGIEKSGLEISYSSKYIIDGFDLYSDETGHDSFGTGIRIALATEQVTVINSDIHDFRRGVVNINKTNSSKGDEFIPDRDINLINVDIESGLGADIETTSKRSELTHVYDNVTELPNNYLNLSFDDASLRFTKDMSEIMDMFPSFETSIQKFKKQEGLMVTGQKSDTLGVTDYPFGNEMARFDRTGVNEILSRDGYQTLKDGTKVVVLGEMITDRVTGETRDKYFVTELPDWWKFDGKEIDSGAYTHYAGVYRPAFIEASNIPEFSSTRYEDIVAQKQAADDAPNMAHHNHHDMSETMPMAETAAETLTEHANHVAGPVDMTGPMQDMNHDMSEMDAPEMTMPAQSETPEETMTHDGHEGGHEGGHESMTPAEETAPSMSMPQETAPTETTPAETTHQEHEMAPEPSSSHLGHGGRTLDGYIAGQDVTVDQNANRISIDLDGDGQFDEFIVYDNNGPQVGLLLRHNQNSTNLDMVRAAVSFNELNRLAGDQINGIVDEDFITGAENLVFNVSVQPSSGASYANVVGVYQYDGAGAISDIRIVTTDARGGSGDLEVTIDAGAKLGLFLIQNGGNIVPDDVLASGDLGISTDGGMAQLTNNGATVPGAVLFVSHDATLNPDELQHVASGADPSHSGGMLVGFEDQLRTGRSDDDFQDVVVLIETEVSGSAGPSVQAATAPSLDPLQDILYVSQGDAADNEIFGAFSALASDDVALVYAPAEEVAPLAAELSGDIDAVVGQATDSDFDGAALLSKFAGSQLFSTGWAQDLELSSVNLPIGDANLVGLATTSFETAWIDMSGDDTATTDVPVSADDEPDTAGVYPVASAIATALFEDLEEPVLIDGVDANDIFDIHNAVSDALTNIA